VWSSDPSSKFEKRQTKAIKDNLNPIFYETLEVHFEFDKLETAPPVVLDLFDKDYGVLDSDDYLGRAQIFLNDASLINQTLDSNSDEFNEKARYTIPKPKWHDVRAGFH